MPLKKKRRPATSCIAYTRGAASNPATRDSRADGLLPMSRTVVTPCASRSRRSRPSSSPALPFGEEEQVDVAVDQAGDEVLPLAVDHPGALRHLAFARGAGAEDAVAADDGDGVGDRRAAGSVPQRGADDGGRGTDGGRRNQLGGGRATGGGHQADQQRESRGMRGLHGQPAPSCLERRRRPAAPQTARCGSKMQADGAVDAVIQASSES